MRHDESWTEECHLELLADQAARPYPTLYVQRPEGVVPVGQLRSTTVALRDSTLRPTMAANGPAPASLLGSLRCQHLRSICRVETAMSINLTFVEIHFIDIIGVNKSVKHIGYTQVFLCILSGLVFW
jgi:hypothetical protein